MSIAPQFRIWHEPRTGEIASDEITQPAWLAESSPLTRAHPDESAVAIWPIRPRATLIGVVVVPPDLELRIALNGSPLISGMHALRHADRLSNNGHEIWIAASAAIETALYDPAVHGEDVFCFLTKARLEVGEEIVRCPGFQGNTCNVIYKKASWDMAMQSASNMHCPNCGFRTGESDWQPPQHRPKKEINALLATITARSA